MTTNHVSQRVPSREGMLVDNVPEDEAKQILETGDDAALLRLHDALVDAKRTIEHRLAESRLRHDLRKQELLSQGLSRAQVAARTADPESVDWRRRANAARYRIETWISNVDRRRRVLFQETSPPSPPTSASKPSGPNKDIQVSVLKSVSHSAEALADQLRARVADGAVFHQIVLVGKDAVVVWRSR